MFHVMRKNPNTQNPVALTIVKGVVTVTVTAGLAMNVLFVV